MSLLAILIALIAERFKPHWASFRSLVWFDRYVAWMRTWFGESGALDGPLGVLFTLMPPLLLVLVLEHQLTQIWALLAFPFATVILFMSLGPKDLDSEVEAFLAAYYAGDEQRMRAHARDLLKGAEPAARSELMRAMVIATVTEANERILNVLFWFMVLGPLGAALYRLSTALKDKCERSVQTGAFNEAAYVLHGTLAWVPVRLSILAYALAGSFTDTVQSWRRVAIRSAEDWIGTSRRCLVAAGLGALRLDYQGNDETKPVVDANQVRAALAMVWRAVIMVVALIALMTLAGWGA